MGSALVGTPKQNRRTRGRPPTVADPHGPLDEWLVSLSPTAETLAECGRRILIERGYRALTLENVALEASVETSTVKRHFGTKAGLVSAVFDRSHVAKWEPLIAQVQGMEAGADRLKRYVAGLGALVTDWESALVDSELTGNVLRDPTLRRRFAAVWEWYRRDTLEVTGVSPHHGSLVSPEEGRRLEAMAALVISAIMGISFQKALDPDSVDADFALAMLGDMMAHYLAKSPPEVEES